MCRARAFRALSPPTGRATAAPESATRAALRFTAFVHDGRRAPRTTTAGGAARQARALLLLVCATGTGTSVRVVLSAQSFAMMIYLVIAVGVAASPAHIKFENSVGLGLFIRRHRSRGAGVTPAVRWAVLGRRRRAGPCAGATGRLPAPLSSSGKPRDRLRRRYELPAEMAGGQ